MAQDDDRVSAGYDILVREKETPDMRADTESGEIVRGDNLRIQFLRPLRIRECDS
jgi:hypothetical protein